MPAPYTVVTFVDEDGDEFPIRLPGCYPKNQAADIEAALQLITEDNTASPRGKVTVRSIEYISQVQHGAHWE